MLDSITVSDRRATFRLSARVTLDDLLKANAEIIEHDNFSAIDRQLWIFQSVNSIEMSGDDIRALIQKAQFVEGLPSGLRLAIVSDTPLAFGLGRMYEALADAAPWEVMIFYKLAEAEEWLG